MEKGEKNKTTTSKETASNSHRLSDGEAAQFEARLAGSVAAELQPGQQPEDDADAIKDGRVLKALRQVHRIEAGLVGNVVLARRELR